MAAKQLCPVCGNGLSGADNICPKCGFRLAGRTESFAPVGSGQSGTGKTAALSPDTITYGFPTLTITKGPMTGEVFHLHRMPVLIGRDPACDLFLNNTTVSRKHAIIEDADGSVFIRDIGSMNGTWVDGEVIEKAELRDGCKVQIGTFSMRYSAND